MFAENITHFARVLRRAGVPVGPDRVIAALEAIEAVGFSHRDDVHAALSAVMLDRHEQQVLFDAAFDAFWRDPKLVEQLMYLLLPKIAARGAVEDRAAETGPRDRRRNPLRDRTQLLRTRAAPAGRLRDDDRRGVRAR